MTTKTTIFELIKIEYRDEKPKYPEFKVSRVHIGYFSNLAAAEQGMKKIIEEEEKQSGDGFSRSIFGFLIEEYVLDKCTYWQTESTRSYLPDGSLWDESLVSEVSDDDGNLEVFSGRPAEKVRFKIDDLVETLYSDTVILEIVGNIPASPEEVRKMTERSRKLHPDYPIQLDASDDSYYTLDQYGEHAHPEATRLFPARLKVSAALRKKMLSKEYHSYRAYCEHSQ